MLSRILPQVLNSYFYRQGRIYLIKQFGGTVWLISTLHLSCACLSKPNYLDFNFVVYTPFVTRCPLSRYKNVCQIGHCYSTREKNAAVTFMISIGVFAAVVVVCYAKCADKMRHLLLFVIWSIRASESLVYRFST